MLFVRIDDQGAVLKYPYSQTDFKADFPEVAMRGDWDCPGVIEMGIAPVAEVDAPAPGPGEVVEEATPALVDGAWSRQWLSRAMTDDETEALRSARIAEVKALRDSRAAAPIATPLGTVDADPASIQKINGAVTMAMLSLQAGEPYSVNWTMTDGTRVAHDAAAIIAMGKAVALFVGACHDAADGLQDALVAAADASSIAGVDIAAGWPGGEA